MISTQIAAMPTTAAALVLRRTGHLTKPLAVEIAIGCAQRVLPIYEKRNPKDRRPRLAIEAAINYVKCPSEANRELCKSAAAAAAAADATYAYAAAAAAAADAAADAAAAAADAADDAAYAYAADAVTVRKFTFPKL